MKWTEMKPYEQDELIHEHIMDGKCPCNGPPGVGYIANKLYTWECSKCGANSSNSEGTYRNHDAKWIPQYSRTWDAAWRVLQKIASRYSEQSQWLVDEQFKEFVEELCECSGNEIYPATKFFVRMAAWTPEHICLLALKTCGWKEGEQ